MGARNRREFLKASAALVSAASARKLFADAREPIAREKIRGVMVDAARVPENLTYYRRVIEFCAEWGLNTLQFRLTDDQGSALRFTSVPDLITHPHAFTAGELHDLVEYGHKHVVDVLPEVEAFGHTGYITRSAAYKHLLDDDPSGLAEFTGVIPVHPETAELFEKLFREVAGIFPSKYLHGGCDEVNWGGSEMSRKALQTRTRAQVWAAWLNQLNAMAKGLGKTFLVWGDYVLGKEPDVLPQLDKSIVIMDWNYWDTDAAKFTSALEKVRANGSRGIGAPGLISYRWGPRPGTTQLGNIDAFTKAYMESQNPASLGIVLTNWVPSRYIQNSLWDGFAYAAVAFNEGADAARKTAFRGFVERHFGATWNEQWMDAFTRLWDAAPMYRDGKRGLTVPFSNDAELATALKHRTPVETMFPQVRALMEKLQPAVTRNAADYQALLLSMRYLEMLLWREGIIQQTAAGKPLERTAAQELIRDIAARDHELLEDLNKDWDAGRPGDSPAKLAPLFGMAAKDQLLFQWRRAAAYSAALAKDTGRFFAVMRSAGMAV